MDDQTTSLLNMTVGIVANYVGNNSIKPEEVSRLIASTYTALQNVGDQQGEEPEVYDQPSAAQIRKSNTEAGLVSFIDGKTYQSLKRHLGTHGLTPADYRDRYGLKDDYPMVSPAYSARRSQLARELGLGQKGRQPVRKGRSKP